MEANFAAAELIALARKLAFPRPYPSPRLLAELAEASVAALRDEDTSVRPRAPSGEPGGYVALGAPFVVVVPDLHARAALLADLLDSVAPTNEPGFAGVKLAEMALDGRVAILCLGDVLNAEGMAAQERWSLAMGDLVSGGPRALLSPAMDEEMGASLATLCLVMMLKARLGEAFHCLKGNHDNLTNSDRDGDSGFRKYALEGAMGAEWFRMRYGREAMAAVRRHELFLPLVAVGQSFCASHAEPAFPIDVPSLLGYRLRPAIVRALTWTENDQAEEGAVAKSLGSMLGERATGSLWLAGHRPVSGAFALRADGRLAQVHNPTRHQIAWIDNRAKAIAPEIRFFEVKTGGGALRPLDSLSLPS